MLLIASAAAFAVTIAVYAGDEQKPATAKEHPGQKVFVDQKCNTCHGVEAAGMKKKAAGGPPDLSLVASRHKGEWITKFLSKEESLNGKKHVKKFAGKPEEVAELVRWFESMKPDTTKATK